LPEADLNVGEEWESSLSALNPSSPETHVECRVGKRGLLADFAVGF
jgi:hypothetical protein